LILYDVLLVNIASIVGPILWGHSGPLCYALLLLLLWTSILHCHSPGVAIAGFGSSW